MAATMTKRPKADEPTTFAEIAGKRMRDRIEQYRASVQRAAAGEQLHGEELAQVLEALTYMGLPEYAWDRDVAAQRDYTAADKALAAALEKKPAGDARLADIVARIKEIEAELKVLQAERNVLANVEPMVRVGQMQRVNELHVNHPHLFLDVADAARMRQEAKDKATGGKPAPAASEPITTCSIGQ